MDQLVRHALTELLRSPSACFEQIAAALEQDSRGVDAVDPLTKQTALHVLCANVCLVDDDEANVRKSSVLLLASANADALFATDNRGATPLDLLASHGGLTTPLLLALLELQPGLARLKLRVGTWWEEQRDSTLLHWLCERGDVDGAAIAALLGAERDEPGTAASHNAARSVGDRASGESAVAATVDSFTGRSPLHALCDNERLVAHNWKEFLHALRMLAGAAPSVVSRVDRKGLKPCDLLDHQHMLRGEALAILVEANPQTAATRLALPPWEQSEWTTRKPPANAAAEEEAALGKEQMREREKAAADARQVFEMLVYGLTDSSEGEATAAAIKVRRVYEQGDMIVKQAAVDTYQLCVALVKLLHHPRCSAPRSAAQRTLLLLSDADTRLKERIGELKMEEMLKVKFIQHEMRETAKLESQKYSNLHQKG